MVLIRSGLTWLFTSLLRCLKWAGCGEGRKKKKKKRPSVARQPACMTGAIALTWREGIARSKVAQRSCMRAGTTSALFLGPASYTQTHRRLEIVRLLIERHWAGHFTQSSWSDGGMKAPFFIFFFLSHKPTSLPRSRAPTIFVAFFSFPSLLFSLPLPFLLAKRRKYI